MTPAFRPRPVSAKKIKENLIKNAKLKQQFAKTLKAEGLTSTRLERDPSLASSSRTSKGKGKGKGKGKERPADEDVAMDDDDANDSEGSAADAPSAGGGGGAVQQQARTDLSDLPHDDSSTARSYRPHARRPMAVHSAAAAGPNGGAGRSSRGEGGRPSVHDGTTTTPTPVATARWAPAKDAKGRARQPKMADKMDAMLAKIRKGL